MLRTLTLRDFVIVDELDIEFEPGYTVFSGETGAGKSILIDALALALGGRGEAGIIRTVAPPGVSGEPSAQSTQSTPARAEIIAVFTPSVDAAAWLAERELENGEDIVLRRVVDSGGRSRGWINGTPATLAQLRELGDLLVDIHGQHEHQLLLKSDAQRRLLDEHAGLDALASETEQLYRIWQSIAARRARLDADAERLREEYDRTAWQVEELERLAPKPGEWPVIQQEHQRLANAAGLIEGTRLAIAALGESDDSLDDRLSGVVQRLRQLGHVDGALHEVVELLDSAHIQIQEAVHGLNHYLDRLELDPERLVETEARMEALHAMARKLRQNPDDLADTLQQLSQRLSELQASSDAEGLAREEALAEAAWRSVAERLSAARAQAALALSAAVSEGMQVLNMQGGRFEVALIPCAPAAHGLEQVELRVAAHPGVPLRPLARVASGGELSRISLAIAVIAGAASSVPTLIFDEVDSGVGGAVAEVVGRLLRQLGSLRQVLCVTHLPQVAAQGEHHFAVSKHHVGGTTLSRVQTLRGSQRVDEVARMLGGIEITPTTRKHARELLAEL